MDIRRIIRVAVIGFTTLLTGCATDKAFQKAFSNESALHGNSKVISAPQARAINVTKLALLHQGFTIEQADAAAGLIKAVRNYHDPDASDVSYNISATVDVTANEPDGSGSTVTLAASQQTVLHREWHDWWHLFWIIPLFPIGTEYQTVVTNEGNITDPNFYKDFFSDIEAALASANGSGTSPPTPGDNVSSQRALPGQDSAGSKNEAVITPLPPVGSGASGEVTPTRAIKSPGP